MTQNNSYSYSNSESDSKYLEPEAKRYLAKLVVMKERFISILDEFKKYYIFSAKNPEVDEYHQHYLNSKSHLQKINKEVFTTTNDIEHNIAKLNKIVMRLNAKLGSEKELDGELVTLINKLRNTQNGSETMLDDSVEIYNKQYYYNLELFIGILLLIAMLSKLTLPAKK